MSNLVPFLFGENTIRVIPSETGEPLFVAKDVAKALEYTSTNMTTIFQAVPDEWKGSNRIATLGGEQDVLVVTEQGLYFFLGRSDKPAALPFQKWLAGEVLPAIRKTGTYTTDSAKLDPEAVLKKYGLSVDDPNINQNVRIELTKMAMRIARMTPEQEQRTFAIFAKLCVITMAHKKKEQEADPANLFINERLAQDNGKIQAKVLYQAFLDWCQVRDLVPGSIKSFCRELRRNFPIIESNKTYFRCRFLTITSEEN